MTCQLRGRRTCASVAGQVAERSSPEWRRRPQRPDEYVYEAQAARTGETAARGWPSGSIRLSEGVEAPAPATAMCQAAGSRVPFSLQLQFMPAVRNRDCRSEGRWVVDAQFLQRSPLRCRSHCCSRTPPGLRAAPQRVLPQVNGAACGVGPGDLGSVAALSQRTDRRGFRCQGVCGQVALATPGRSCGSEAAEAVPLRAWSKPHSRPAAQLNGARAEAFERRKHASASADRQLNEITGPQAGHVKGAGPQAKHLDINVTAREVRRHATLTMQERALGDPGRPPASPGRLALSVGNIQRSGAQRPTECRPSAIHIHRGWP
jgi:hypothetical protein